MNLMKRFVIAIVFFMIGFNDVLTQEQQENLELLNRWLEWSNAENLLDLHLYEQACNYLDVREEKIAGLKTKSDWQKRQYHVRQLLTELVGPFPEKTPLNPIITGVVQKDGYRFEKIIYESMPDYHVTGCLFIPDGIMEKTPAILFVSGHSLPAFRAETYQWIIHNLVKKGFIVFAIDPMGQGERIQYSDEEKNRVGLAIGKTTHEHSYANNQCLLSGSSAARYWVWDGMRAIDYLISREEVDANRIGVAGRSGGGTQTAYIAAFDERVAAAAPEAYICGFRRLLGMIGPQDGEQIFVRGISSGLDHSDLIEVCAPKPYIVVTTTRDYFSIQGARETYQEAKKAYRAFGKEENLRMVEDDHVHGSTKKNREAVYRFFQEVFDMPGDFADEEVTILDEEELHVTPTGRVGTYLHGETIFSINKSETEKLIDNLNESRSDIDSHLKKVEVRAKEHTGWATPPDENEQVFRGRYQRDGYSVELYALHGEGDYVIPILLMIPEGGGKHPAVVYINPEGKSADALPGGTIEKFVKHGFIVAAADVIGIGETEGDYSYPGRSGYGAVLIGRSIVGIHAGDIVRVVTMLKDRTDVDSDRINALAYDELCPALLHAAAFEPAISGTVLIGAPVSYNEIASHKLYKYSLTFHWGVAKALEAYDLPDLAASVAPRKLLFVDLKNALKERASKKLIGQELAFPLRVYSNVNASNKLKIIADTHIEEIIDWLAE